jgi:hypothetical protein
MPDREKAIRILEGNYKNFVLRHNGELLTVNELIALLKAQDPKVMTLQEALGAEVNVDQCWLEVKGIKQIYLADAVVCPDHTERADIQRWGASDCRLPLDLYGAYWRMWTAKPTDAQREATPWEQ